MIGMYWVLKNKPGSEAPWNEEGWKWEEKLECASKKWDKRTDIIRICEDWINSRDRQVRSCGEGRWGITEGWGKRTLTCEMLQLFWAWRTRRGSAEGSDAGRKEWFRPISGQKEQVRHRDSGASALLLWRLTVSRCSAIFIPTIKELQSRLQQGRGWNRHPNHQSAEQTPHRRSGWRSLKDLQRDHCRELWYTAR